MKNVFALLIFTIATLSLNAQQLQEGCARFSDKKLSIINLEDGTVIKGYLKDLDRKKGLIKKVVIKDESGKKHKLMPDQIKSMYLKPSGLMNYVNAVDKVTDVKRWDEDLAVDDEYINDGYVLLEKSDVKIKKKTIPMLLQLLNPDFAKKVKIYYNPYAKESASLGVGGFKVAGGIAKSYFVKIGDEAAYKIGKKSYDKNEKAMFGDCASLNEKYNSNLRWKDLAEHVLHYTLECN